MSSPDSGPARPDKLADAWPKPPLADAAALSSLAKGGAAAIFALADGSAIWWNEAGAVLFSLPRVDGLARDIGPALARAASSDRPWLERRRISVGRLPCLATVQFGRAALQDGAQALVAVAARIEPPILASGRAAPPRALRPPISADAEAPEKAPSSAAEPRGPAAAPQGASPAPAGREQGGEAAFHPANRRLTWQTDATGRLLAGPGASLSQALGRGAPMQPARLSELLTRQGDFVEEAIGSGRPLSGVPVETVAAPDGIAFAGNLFGAPVLDKERRAIGYRGFLLVAGTARAGLPTREEDTRPGLAEERPRPPVDELPDAGLAAAPTEESRASRTEPAGVPQSSLATPRGAALGQVEALAPLARPLESSERPSNVIALRLPNADAVRQRDTEAPALSPAERDAFADIARALGAVSTAAVARPGSHSPAQGVGAEAGEGPDGQGSAAGAQPSPGADAAESLDGRTGETQGLGEAPSGELAARESEIEDLRAILEGAIDGVVTIDALGRILAMNRSAERLFGYRAREIAGEALAILAAPECHHAVAASLSGAKAGRQAIPPEPQEITGRGREGRRIPLSLRLFAGASRPDARLYAVFGDQSAAKASEGALIEARVTAERTTAQKSEFLAKVSHEIRTPLNSIVGFADIIAEERFGPLENERYKEYVRDIRASGTHIISLVNDLLDLSKIEAGRLELAFTNVSLNSEVAAAVASVQAQAARSRVLMRQSLAQTLPAIVADQRSIKQIVLNILSNAVKFTEPGGQVIVSTALSDKGEVILRVRDTGIGMSERELAEAMEPFRQFATTQRPGGSGLGLSLTKALVKANQANLSISSAAREGTLVEIVFPQARVIAT